MWHLVFSLNERSCLQLPAQDWSTPSGGDAALQLPPSLWSHVARRFQQGAWRCGLHAGQLEKNKIKQTNSSLKNWKQKSILSNLNDGCVITMPPHSAHWWQMHFLQVQQKTLSFSWWFSHLQSKGQNRKHTDHITSSARKKKYIKNFILSRPTVTQ